MNRRAKKIHLPIPEVNSPGSLAGLLTALVRSFADGETTGKVAEAVEDFALARQALDTIKEWDSGEFTPHQAFAYKRAVAILEEMSAVHNAMTGGATC